MTGSDSEDSGAASGWSISDGSVNRDHDSTGSWGIHDNSLKIRINGQVIAPPPEVPADSSLVPSGLGPGDQFRLIFLSSETRTAEATDIATYNAWVQALAANGHADIQDHSSTFRVVGSTAAVDARDNTSTTYTASDKGVAIYWLNGDKAADDYEDFYDETWDEEASMRDESGTTVTAPSSVFTGSKHDGTKIGWPLGNTGLVTIGIPNSTGTGHGPLSSSVSNSSTLDKHLYALSGVFQVGAIEVPDDWSLVPSGLQEGDQFRLLFISSTSRNASPSNIATYNTWIQARAASGHTDIQDYSSSFRAVGSTEDMDARDNTGTTYTSSDKGVAIYWLGGNKVADDYADFYDEDWDEEASMTNESGTAESGVSAWTGSDHDGTEMLPRRPRNQPRPGELRRSLGALWKDKFRQPRSSFRCDCEQKQQQTNLRPVQRVRGGCGEQPGHRPAHHHRNGPGGGVADGGHIQHRRPRRHRRRRVRIPVGLPRRNRRRRHIRRHGGDLPAAAGPPGPDHQGAGQLHR